MSDRKGSITVIPVYEASIEPNKILLPCTIKIEGTGKNMLPINFRDSKFVCTCAAKEHVMKNKDDLLVWKDLIMDFWIMADLS